MTSKTQSSKRSLSPAEARAREQANAAFARNLASATQETLHGARWSHSLMKAIVLQGQPFPRAMHYADARGPRGHLAHHPLSQRYPVAA